MISVNFTPANNTEKMLFIMPKNCSCPICQATKQKAKNELGTKRYNKLVKQLGFVS